MSITEEDLIKIRDRATLFAFLREKLNWPVDPEDTFTYEGPKLAGEAADRAEVSRILPFSSGDPFAIFLVEFSTTFRRGDLREILRKIREQIRTQSRYEGRSLDELVFICAAEQYGGIRFAHFEAREKTAPLLRVFGFDRGQSDMTRTLRELNLPALAMPAENVLGEPDWDEGRARWMTAWDVERVTDAFFKRYREIFAIVQGRISGAAVEKRLFTQRLFNRLMFIHFLSRKPEGWLKFNGDCDYLKALWEGRDRSANFYSAHLRPLFFTALNNPHVKALASVNPVLYSKIGDVPYLNGGLFQKADDDDTGETIEDSAFELIIGELFGRYNFTVHESTPDDIEVAVDPEMLGKVFEELVNEPKDRHDSGSYYTPRGIVQFMCREALKGYLVGHDELVDKHDASAISVPSARQILVRLADIKVADPACGSGAYLLGMLHELFTLHRLLDTRADQSTARDDYARKLTIIRNNIYGVDLDRFAVEIARLRLWLSLIVEYNGDTPEPLPNLDYKVEQGDSLSAPAPNPNVTPDMFRWELVEKFSKKKAEFADPYYEGDKAAVKKEIDELKRQIASDAHADEQVQGFDWRVEFAEVFEPQVPVADIGGAMNFGDTLTEPAMPGGFDVVLANPPYVRQELIRDLKPTLKRVYPEVYTGVSDLYCYFYARAIQLLRKGGMLVFISPNKWFRAGYGAKLREHIANGSNVLSITDFGDLPVFQAATAYPMIFIAQKGETRTATTLTQVDSLESPYPDVLAIQRSKGQQLPESAFSGSDWTLANSVDSGRQAKMRSAGVPLGDYVRGQIYYGVKTGLNAAFVIDGAKRAELIAADSKSAEIIKPLLTGKDIKRWSAADSGKFLIVTRIGVEIQRYPAIFTHLSQWQESLESRQDQGNHWWELRACAYYSAFDRPKIVYPVMCKEPDFAHDSIGAFTNDKCFIIPTGDLYLLGVLNSSTIWSFITTICSPLRGGFYEMRSAHIQNIPIARATEEDKAVIASLVQKCLEVRGDGCESWEAEINERVAEMYGF